MPNMRIILILVELLRKRGIFRNQTIAPKSELSEAKHWNKAEKIEKEILIAAIIELTSTIKGMSAEIIDMSVKQLIEERKQEQR